MLNKQTPEIITALSHCTHKWNKKFLLLLDMWTICSLSAQQVNGANHDTTLSVVLSVGRLCRCHTIELNTRDAICNGNVQTKILMHRLYQQ